MGLTSGDKKGAMRRAKRCGGYSEENKTHQQLCTPEVREEMGGVIEQVVELVIPSTVSGFVLSTP